MSQNQYILYSYVCYMKCSSYMALRPISSHFPPFLTVHFFTFPIMLLNIQYKNKYKNNKNAYVFVVQCTYEVAHPHV